MFISPQQPGLGWNCGDVGTKVCLSWKRGVDGGKREESGIECFNWAERRLYLADNSYSRVHYCATANSRDGGNKQRLQKRQTNDSTLHSKLFSSYTGFLYRVYRVTLKVKQSGTVYLHLLRRQKTTTPPKKRWLHNYNTDSVTAALLILLIYSLVLFP